jgi:hypothetical protein
MPALPHLSSHFEGPSDLEDLGKIHNFLGILAPDYNHFLPKRLLDIYPHASDLAQMLDLQRTQVYSKKPLPLKKGSSLRKRLIYLVIATDLAYTLLDKKVDKTCHWLTAPNFILFGETPLEVIMRDEGEPLISWLMERLGLKPGSAF